ncbi:uncharacterized protein JCM15063_006489 [Sporobolomyces koalae]|uniref:uncharacterized protein n=1 Tax=Sporobolomyces koalae TaxID=500713 RepID=UPI003174EE0B
MSSLAIHLGQPSSSGMSSYEPPVTPVRATLELLPPPPPHARSNPRKRAPPSPLDATFASCRRNHLFTLSTATNIGLGSPSTPTAPLLPAAPIFMPMPVTPTPTKLSSSPMRRSPGIRAFSKFTFDAFNEESGGRGNGVDENSWTTSASCSPPRAASMSNSLGLFDFYREESSPEFSSPELPGSPSSFSDPTGSLWEDESDGSESSPISPSAIIFARRISLDLATASSSLSRSLPNLTALPTVERNPLGSPVPSLSSSASTTSSPSSRSSPCGSDSNLSLRSFATESTEGPCTPSPTTACLSTFSSTSFFDSPSPLQLEKPVPSFSQTSPLAQRRLESLSRRRLQKLSIGTPEGSTTVTCRTPVSSPTSSASGLGLFA